MSLRSFPPSPGTFTCDICGEPGEKRSRQQKRHDGACAAAFQRRLHQRNVRRLRAKHGVQARRARRNA